MAIESRLRRAETAADLWIQRQFAELDRQLLAAGSDCTRVFCIHMARAIVADGPDPRTLASLRDNGAWLAQRETEEPGFTRRIEGELSRRGLLDAEL